MATANSLADKVIVVTGAGRGIGREMAILAAAEGAKVVVNDLGGAADGEGKDAGPAEEVVGVIRKTGGKAVISADSVADAEGATRIIQTAIDNYGRIDSVINNAGILRDRIFHRMSNVDFELVIKVHLMGTYYVSRTAANFFKDQSSGTMVHFTSTSGLIGNFGQANYAAAKMGIVGLSRGIALDMARYNVRSNCVSPFAWSRLIGTIPTDTDEEKQRVERIKTMGAEKIAPLAIFLASDLSKGISGQIFAARKDEIYLFSQPRPVRNAHCSEGWTAQGVLDSALPMMRAGFYGLDRSSDVFTWDPA